MKNPPQLILSAIVAMTENRVIGKNNQLPWHLPADLKHFKDITTGHPILMGRKTYESIGRPLPNRINIILTRDASFKAEGCFVAHSLDEAMKLAASHHSPEVFVIGGAEIYKQLLPHIDQLYLTIIHQTVDGDAFFPELNAQEWQEVARETHQPDDKNKMAYSFLKWKRAGKPQK